MNYLSAKGLTSSFVSACPRSRGGEGKAGSGGEGKAGQRGWRGMRFWREGDGDSILFLGGNVLSFLLCFF